MEYDTSKFDGLVQKIRNRDRQAFEDLYGLSKNFTFFLMRQLGPDDVQDRIHDIFVTVAQAICSGKMRDPDRLVPFVTTVARLYTYSQIDRRRRRRQHLSVGDQAHVADPSLDLEQSLYQTQRRRIATEVLKALSPRHREILQRFYLHEQTKEQICAELKLTPTQFRLLKSKAKSSFAKLGAKRLADAAAVAA